MNQFIISFALIVTAMTCVTSAQDDQVPDSAQRVKYLIEEASDLYFRDFWIDASGFTTLYGLPSPEQSERAQGVAREMFELANEASSLVVQAIVDIETASDFTRRKDLQLFQQQLVEIERDRRIPFLYGISAFLHAELNETDQTKRNDLHTESTQQLESLVDELHGMPQVHARLFMGFGLLRLEQFDSAEECFQIVLSDSAADVSDRFAAQIGKIFIAEAHDSEAALELVNRTKSEYTNRKDVLYRMILADRKFLLERSSGFSQALNAYIELLDEDFDLPRGVLQSIVLNRLANAVDESIPSDQLPPIANLARGVRLARDENTREEAIVMLEVVLSENDLSKSMHAAGLYLLGQALYDYGEPLFAAQRFIELARNHPTDHLAERAIDLGVELAEYVYDIFPSDTQARETLYRGLNLLLDRYPNLGSIDHWRFAAAQLAFDDGNYELAIHHFNQVTTNADEWLDSQFMLSQTSLGKVETAPDKTQRKKLTRELLKVISRSEELITSGMAKEKSAHREATLRSYLAQLRINRAEARLQLNEPKKAIDALSSLDEDPSIGSEILGRALEVRLRAFRALNQHKEIEAAVVQILQQSTKDPSGEEKAQINVPTIFSPLLNSLSQEIRGLTEEGKEIEASRLVDDVILPVVHHVDDWFDRSDQLESERLDLGLQIAELYRLTNQFEKALGWYDYLLIEYPEGSELLFGRAECLFHLGSEDTLADAILIYRRLIAGTSPGGETYWLSQLRTLQILDRVGKKTEQIIPRIERLRQLDPEFGGEEFAREFIALRLKYSNQ